MPSYAPDAIRAAYNTIAAAIPSAQFGGIANPGRPTAYGYHNARANHLRINPGDYSIQRPLDRQGDPWAGSALDVTLPRSQMIACTRRLIRAMGRKDPRVRVVREFFGTLDGVRVTGRDAHGYTVTADKSHLWHIHVSGYRKFANDHAAWQQFAAVFTGAASKPTPGKDKDMTPAETEAMIMEFARKYHMGDEDGKGRFTQAKYPNVIKKGDGGIGDRITRLEKRKP